MITRVLVWLVLAAGAGFSFGSARADDLARFLAERNAAATALSAPIAACVAKQDTNHPVFRGCIDWHSSVHGVWALTAYGRMTGDTRYRDLVLQSLPADGLAQERAYLRDHPTFELPYGRAWFLRLAVDYKRAFGDGRLDALASDVAESLIVHYRAVTPDPLSTDYDSATWALINLHDYGAFMGDERIVGFVADQVRRRYLRREVCPLQRVEVETREFMAVCTNWAWLVSKVLPRAAFKAWLAEFLPAELVIAPIRDAASVHQAGLNFSRTWGLWHIYRASGEQRFLRAYLDHFAATYGQPEVWNGDYNSLSHWVAQFGMLGLAVTFDAPEPAGRP